MYVRVGVSNVLLDVHPESGKCNCGVSAIVRITLRDGTFHEDVGYGHAEGVRGKHAALEKVSMHVCRTAAHMNPSAKKRPLPTLSNEDSRRLAGYWGT